MLQKTFFQLNPISDVLIVVIPLSEVVIIILCVIKKTATTTKSQTTNQQNVKIADKDQSCFLSWKLFCFWIIFMQNNVKEAYI